MGDTCGAVSAAEAEAAVPRFKFERLLNQDQAGRRIVLQGNVDDKPALLLAERAAFSSESAHLTSFAPTLSSIQNLGANDIYSWFLASSAPPKVAIGKQNTLPPDLKLNLIWPCTEQHVKKYSQQGTRLVQETPEIYRDYVRPFMQSKREAGRLNWVFNIIEGRTEQENVLYREHGEEGFLLLPDLNWDRKTMGSFHVLGLVERRDLWSLRDLQNKHVTWLKHMREKLIDTAVRLYDPHIEADQLKLYFHYQPTYYHLHIHIVHVQLEAGATQAVGKAVGLDAVIAHLEGMTANVNGAADRGMADATLSYTVGEASELWTEIFEPLKRRQTPRSSNS